jgi:hypothetical protein
MLSCTECFRKVFACSLLTFGANHVTEIVHCAGCGKTVIIMENCAIFELNRSTCTTSHLAVSCNAPSWLLKLALSPFSVSTGFEVDCGTSRSCASCASCGAGACWNTTSVVSPSADRQSTSLLKYSQALQIPA